MKPFLRIVLAIIILMDWDMPAKAQGDRMFIPLQHDTLFFENQQRQVSYTGDAVKAVVKLKDTFDRTSIYFIDSGFIKQRVDSDLILNLVYITNFSNRKLNGNYQIKNSSGIAIVNGYYKDDYEDSTWTFCYYNGVKETEGRFNPDTSRLIDGFVITLMQGVAESWGPIEFHKLLKHSPPDGDWNFYNESGRLIKSLNFDKGILKAITVGGPLTK